MCFYCHVIDLIEINCGYCSFNYAFVVSYDCSLSQFLNSVSYFSYINLINPNYSIIICLFNIMETYMVKCFQIIILYSGYMVTLMEMNLLTNYYYFILCSFTLLIYKCHLFFYFLDVVFHFYILF